MTSRKLNSSSSWGISNGYKGADQQWHSFSDKSVNAVLSALESVSLDTNTLDVSVYVFTRSELATAHISLNKNYADGLSVQLEDGTNHAVTSLEGTNGITISLPPELPWGYHHICDAAGHIVARLIVTPDKLEPAESQKNIWGFTAQIYAIRSSQSWGIGDAADLKSLCIWAGQQGADFLSINPIHAGSVTTPIENSPYLPSSRRYFSPLMLAIEELPEFQNAPLNIQNAIKNISEPLKAHNRTPNLIDREPIFSAKMRSLEMLWDAKLAQHRQEDFNKFVIREGKALIDFSLWCVLVEDYGEENDLIWDSTHGPDSKWAETQLNTRADRVSFHQWVQFLLSSQLADAQRAAISTGMSIGIVHDLAVGVKRYSADVWTLPRVMVPEVSVGAPPDNYNQLGQNWSQPPWHPVALRRSGYAPFIHMIRKLCSIGGGIRIDHILGLFRLWWIPQDLSPTEGVYVPYPVNDLLKILVLEATRQRCVVIGEDLGTVPDEITLLLKHFGLWGTSVLWYEYSEDGIMRAPEATRSQCMMAVSTHDMPPVSAYLAGNQVELRAELDILANSPEAEWKHYLANRADMVEQAVATGVWPEHSTPGDDAEVVGIYRLMWRTPAVAKAIALADIACDQRSENVPGTDKEYPNWCIPLTDRSGKALLVSDLDNLPVWKALKKELFNQ